MAPKYIALSGGVGGAKLAVGLARELSPDQLLIVANTGDDFEHLGLRVCPDLDSITYALAGCENRTQGWGIEGESWNFMDALAQLNGETWFALGDRDLATHVMRSLKLRAGASLTQVTQALTRALGIKHHVVPMSDDPVSTLVETDSGTLNFQDYFVRLRCAPPVTSFSFAGAQQAAIQADLRAALTSPELRAVILCPSNPFVSIGPILELSGMRELLAQSSVPVVAVSPFIDGKAIKGPAAKMMQELGMPVTNTALAEHYRGTVTAWVIDHHDRDQAQNIRDLGFGCRAVPTLMNDDKDRTLLAKSVVEYCDELIH
ncbi:2-phospho-L-lactate transferase [Pseudomonas frederiksbergensis]|uniref:2-phospho-L-lactate transferase n=1 Tax=Pseudomonas frederiksbergensis TaxID=104087 RepID=A0AB33EJE3_9PSED|nr:2-phospho-L-lactate transferase [Pseudomonas frederiksbergensis]